MLFALLYRLLMFWIMTNLSLGEIRPNGDSFYFPDQRDYIMQSAKCKDDLIVWPGTGRCYRVGEQGPCNIGRTLRFDTRYLMPYCADS